MSRRELKTPRRYKLALVYAVTGGVPRRSLSVAVVVGSVLNLINQGDRLAAGKSLDLVKLALTYCVPYFVSTYGAVSFRLYADRALLRRSACGGKEEFGDQQSRYE